MANIDKVRREPIIITLSDDKPRELVFTLNALGLIEEKYGSVQAGFEKLDQQSVLAVRYILWAALQHSSPELTEQQVGDMIDVRHLQDYMSTLGTAFKADNQGAEETTKAIAQQKAEQAVSGGMAPVEVTGETSAPNV